MTDIPPGMAPEEWARLQLIANQGSMLGAFWPLLGAVIYLLEVQEDEMHQRLPSLDYEARVEVEAEISRVRERREQLQAFVPAESA